MRYDIRLVNEFFCKILFSLDKCIRPVYVERGKLYNSPKHFSGPYRGHFKACQSLLLIHKHQVFQKANSGKYTDVWPALWYLVNSFYIPGNQNQKFTRSALFRAIIIWKFGVQHKDTTVFFSTDFGVSNSTQRIKTNQTFWTRDQCAKDAWLVRNIFSDWVRYQWFSSQL